MFIVRPCKANDFEGVEQLIHANFSRVSSLPREPQALAERIELSELSFTHDPAVQGREFFLFILENTETGEILGTSGINVNADKRHPFYSYRIGELIHSSPSLNTHATVPVLYLTHELTGKTVLSSFSIKTNYLDTHYFDLLSRSRLLFIASFPERFSDEIVVELQGLLSENDHSPFWDGLGKHFFNMDYATADYYTGIKSRTLLAEMMPAHPIYVSLLSDEARDAMGSVDHRAERNQTLLYHEGFKDSLYVDIFDGGLTLVGTKESLNSICHSRQKRVRAREVNAGPNYLVANTQDQNFCVTLAQLSDGAGDILGLDSSVTNELGLQKDEAIRYVAL